MKSLLILFFAASILFAITVPAFESPDEPSHLGYINYIARTGELPNQHKANQTVTGEGHQPPLYYAIAASIVWLFEKDHQIDTKAQPNKLSDFNGGTNGSVPVFQHSSSIFQTPTDNFVYQLVRLLGIFFAAIVLLYTYKSWLLLFPEKKNLAFIPPFLIATLPQFVFMGFAINNDMLGNALATLVVYWTLRIYKQPDERKPYLWLGIFLGLCLITKQTLLFLAPVSALFVIYILWIQKSAPQRLAIIKSSIVAIIITLLIAGWFYIRNQLLYGDPFAAKLFMETFASISFHQPLFSSYFITPFLPVLFTSFVGKLGWMYLYIPSVIYYAYAIGFFVAGIGFIKYISDKKLTPPILFLALLIIADFATVVGFNMSYPQPQGRYLFPVIAPIALIVTLGWDSLTIRLTDKQRGLLAIAIGILLALGLIISLVVSYQFFVNPANYS